MANNSNIEQRIWILKKYWKYENAETIRTAWHEAFHTPSSTRQTIYRLRNKFNITGSASNAPKSGRPKTSTTEENKTLVAVTFINSLHGVLPLNCPSQEHHCNAYCIA